MGRNLRWLIRLRWCAIAGQLVTLVVVETALGAALPLLPLGLLIGLEVVTNLAITWIRPRGGMNDERWVAALLGLDVVILTIMLHQTGGAENPFSFVYLINIAVATVMLRARWTWALVGLSLAGSAVLFLDHRPLPIAGLSHADAMRIHLQGMWVAFGVSAGLIVYFLLRLLREIALRETELAAARARADRQERVGALATLAAGAAHELATPLSTIAVVAGELERQSATAQLSIREDVRLIRSEVERCRLILDGMSADAGATAGEAPALVCLGTFVDEALGASPGISLAMDERARAATLMLPRRAVAQSLRNLVDNAREADPDRRVRVVAELAPSGARIEVRDRGQGMSAEVLARIGEPFFTTKAPGQGMGLGLFLARTVVERVGGELHFDSTEGNGTVAVMTLPLAAP